VLYGDPYLSHHHDILVEDVVDEDRDAAVVVAAVHQQQLAQETELSDGEVGRVDGLHSFLARDANTHLRYMYRYKYRYKYLSIYLSVYIYIYIDIDRYRYIDLGRVDGLHSFLARDANPNLRKGYIYVYV